MSDIKQFVLAMNQAWQEKRYDDLAGYFHNQAVMLPPGDGKPITGVETMVDSYRQFGAIGTIHSFKATGIELYEFGSAVICHLHFDVDYEIEAGRFREQGLEVYAIDTSGPDPKILWRTQRTAGA